MLNIEMLSKSYNGRKIIENLSFTLPDTGIFALMGPSGCGKTTLLRLLCGLEKPDNGNISVSGKISVVFQEPRLLPRLDAAGNIAFVMNKDRDAEKISSLLAAMELGDVAAKRPGELSGGMRQRLSLARALAYDGDVFLLDEPFSALDTALRDRIAPLLRDLGKKKLIFAVTHDKEDAARLGAKILTCSGDPFSAIIQ